MRVNKANVSGPVAQVHGIETSHRRTKSGEGGSSQNDGTNIFVHRNDAGSWCFIKRSQSPKNMLQNVLPPNLKDEWLVS
jgi:hypothetical protein